MKKVYLAFVATFLVLLVSAGISSAEIEAGSFTLTPYLGGYVFDDGEDLKNGTAVGAGLGYNYTENIGVEAVFDYVDSEVKSTGQSADAKMLRFDGLYHFLPKERLVPYLAAGLGFIDVNAPNDEDDFSPAVDFGAGLTYSINDNLQLRGDVRSIYEIDGSDNHLLYTVGITYVFGKKEPLALKEKVVIDLKVQFDFDKAEIKSVYKEHLQKVADFLGQYPNTEGTIEGHTDSIGTEEYNLKLSQKRAENVRQYLIGNFGIKADRLKAVGYGESRPIADNSTKEGRAKNRRAVAVISTTVTK